MGGRSIAEETEETITHNWKREKKRRKRSKIAKVAG